MRRCDVRAKYASHRVPILMGAHPGGRVPGAPPCIWTFLSSLGKSGSFSNLLDDSPGKPSVFWPQSGFGQGSLTSSRILDVPPRMFVTHIVTASVASCLMPLPGQGRTGWPLSTCEAAYPANNLAVGTSPIPECRGNKSRADTSSYRGRSLSESSAHLVQG